MTQDAIVWSLSSFLSSSWLLKKNVGRLGGPFIKRNFSKLRFLEEIIDNTLILDESPQTSWTNMDHYAYAVVLFDHFHRWSASLLVVRIRECDQEANRYERLIYQFSPFLVVKWVSFSACEFKSL